MRTQSHLDTIPHPDAQTGLAQWRELTRHANAAFDRRQFAHALRLYRQALQTAADLLTGPALAAAPDDCLAALVVAHHNVSETHRQRRDPAGTLKHLCLPHEALIRIAADPRAPAAARVCAVHHLSRTRLALLDWQTRHGTCTKTQTLLRDGQSALSTLGTAVIH